MYNSKEWEDELGVDWYAYGARNYDAAVGRFFNIDRFATKYFSQSPYGYVANDPIHYVDINGDSINVSNLLTSTEGLYTLFYMISDLQEITGLNISVNGTGMLTSNGVANKDKNGKTVGSAKARAYFMNIAGTSKSPSGRDIVVKNNNSKPTEGGGVGSVNINSNQIDNNIQAAKDAGIGELTFGYGMSFLHETLHTANGTFSINPKATKAIQDQVTSSNPRGPTVDQVNIFRNELGLYERSQYKWRTSQAGTPGVMNWSKGGNTITIRQKSMSPTMKALRRGEAIIRKRK